MHHMASAYIFLVWPQMTSRGFQRPNTSFLLKLKKKWLKTAMSHDNIKEKSVSGNHLQG